MVTKNQATSARHGSEFHYGDCKVHVGPRGGERLEQTRVRVSGSCKVWKRDPERFRLPVKFGLYESSAIEQHNASEFHAAEDCQPVRIESKR